MHSDLNLQTILDEILSRHAPELAHVETVSDPKKLSERQAERVREGLDWGFCEIGLTQSDAPNRRGELLESLIASLPLPQNKPRRGNSWVSARVSEGEEPPEFPAGGVEAERRCRTHVRGDCRSFGRITSQTDEIER